MSTSFYAWSDNARITECAHCARIVFDPSGYTHKDFDPSGYTHNYTVGVVCGNSCWCSVKKRLLLSGFQQKPFREGGTLLGRWDRGKECRYIVQYNYESEQAHREYMLAWVGSQMLGIARSEKTPTRGGRRWNKRTPPTHVKTLVYGT